MPMPAYAADPPLGEAVTLPDGTVLPPMPVEQITPTAQSEMLAENGGLVVDEQGVALGPMVETSIATEGAAVEAASPLIVTEAAAVGPAGPLPNQLRREVLGFLPYWKLDAATRSALRMDLLSTIAYFSIGVQSNGYLARGPVTSPTVGWTGWTSSAMTEVINAAHARGVRVVPTITMMAWNGDYSAMSTLLNSPTYRGRLVADVVKVVGDRRADGVNIDFEPVPSSLRSQFTALVRQIKAGLVAARVGSYVTVDTMAGAATWSTGYDVVGLTASGAADALMVMAYDFHYAGSARAGGVAPMDSNTIFAATDAMRDHLARVPAAQDHLGRAVLRACLEHDQRIGQLDRSLTRAERRVQLLRHRRRDAVRGQGARRALRSQVGRAGPGSLVRVPRSRWWVPPGLLRRPDLAAARSTTSCSATTLPESGSGASAWTPASATCGT